MRALLLAAVTLLGLALPSTSRAFQDPMRFGAEPTEAGGGGRYFTGSPADGFGCSVCHTGYRVPVQIVGLPDGRYIPGRSYPIDITWPAGLPPVGMNAEVTDSLGNSVGELSTPPPEQLGEDDFCEPVDLGTPAVGVLPVPTEVPERPRQLGIAFACGAHRASLVWTAPEADAGPVWFAGGIVVSDEQGTVDGDGVTEFVKLIGSNAQPDPLAASIEGRRSDCSVTLRPVSGRATPVAWLSLALLASMVRRRRRARLSRSRVAAT